NDNRTVASTPLASAALRPAGIAERFFQWSLYLLLVTGFVALAGTSKLDFPSLAVVIPALALRGYHLWHGKTVIIPERWTSYLTIVYFAFYVADYFLISQTFISATVHMVLFSMVVKIFSVQRDRDLFYLAVIAFLMVLATVVLTVDTMFLFTFFLFMLVAMATFISLEMRRSERQAQAAAALPGKESGFPRSLSAVVVVLAVSTLLGGALIFLVLPRIHSGGYLRNLGAQGEVISGFSQSVNLGGIGEIQQSNTVVMHVQVMQGQLPADAKWRGVALANFDGHRWWNEPMTPELSSLGGSPLDLSRPRASGLPLYSTLAGTQSSNLSYRVVMEPLGLTVFFMVPAPIRLAGNYRLVAITDDGTVFNVQPNASVPPQDPSSGEPVGIYIASSDTRDPQTFAQNSSLNDYPAHVALVYLQLPRLDPRIPALARQITAGKESNYARVKAIEEYLQQSYGYTLQLPARPGPDPLATFLFERKRGHCEYFASSMVVMARTLGIPARMVNGFRGGEFNEITNNYIVRERDAHSWVEVYFPEYGWVTFDPTPAAPAPVRGSRWSRLELYMDAARELWREWVISYDFAHQMQLSASVGHASTAAQFRTSFWLRRNYRQMLGAVRQWLERSKKSIPRDFALAGAILAFLMALPFAPKGWKALQQKRALSNPQRAPKTSASLWYLKALKILDRRGMPKPPTQTPAEFARGIADPKIREDVVVFTRHYERARFAESAEDAQLLPALYEEIAGHK
ncbi:MAG TPA: DUF3488 and transglutaminase-like domain-containing protein, partial [Alphaproteobacteria bacterium]|nr:DUF3488 and transglutaminase-like domain-containing protein [Alphaproteobacteria bacterium]